MGATIRPTHKCFDDALDYISERLRADPALVNSDSLILAHGIFLLDEGPRMDESFAHAWVEDRVDGTVWQGGLVDGIASRIFWGVSLSEFEANFRPQDVTRYSIREAWEENRRTNHFGPWVDRYAALCLSTRRDQR